MTSRRATLGLTQYSAYPMSIAFRSRDLPLADSCGLTHQKRRPYHHGHVRAVGKSYVIVFTR